MMVPFGHVLALAGVLFLMGMLCTVTRRNLIMIVLGVEVMLNAAMILLVTAALRWQQVEGQTFVIFIFAIAAAEVSLGLALIVWVYRHSGTIDSSFLGANMFDDEKSS
jgi:NADH-quinone oxidoreductase subunit K